MKDRVETFLSHLSATDATLSFFCNFPEVKERVDSIAISLTMLNYLIGKKDLKAAVKALWERDSTVFQVMDILIALRGTENNLFVDRKGRVSDVHTLLSSVNGVMTFLSETGLADILKNREITNLVDYVFGVETGLDANARVNRRGRLLECFVTGAFDDADIEYRTQVPAETYPEVRSVPGDSAKIFDLAVETESKIYLIDVNFYPIGNPDNPELKETARSNTDIGSKINKLPGYEFVWITDGPGWLSARDELEAVLDAIPSVYSMGDLKELVSRIKNPYETIYF